MIKTKTVNIRCSACGTKNRIPSDKSGVTARCGKCSALLDTTDLFDEKPLVVTDNNFSEKVLKSPIPVLLDCWAPWCGPCRMIGPVIDEIAGEYSGRFRICKLNVDENPGTSAKYNIASIPTMLIFDRAELKDRLVGALPKQQIIHKISGFLL
ncbi:MAG: thioredoxin [Desulfobacteraceae bacterium]|nr:MAG: thioredoxin [Desulfobacteraceae bacterium]